MLSTTEDEENEEETETPSVNIFDEMKAKNNLLLDPFWLNTMIAVRARADEKRSFGFYWTDEQLTSLNDSSVEIDRFDQDFELPFTY